MRYLFAVVSVLALIMCGLIFKASQSAVHEIEALMFGLIGVLAMGVAAIVGHLENVTEELRRVGAIMTIDRQDRRQQVPVPGQVG